MARKRVHGAVWASCCIREPLLVGLKVAGANSLQRTGETNRLESSASVQYATPCA